MGLASRLSRKLKKVLDCRTDNPEVMASFNALSTFYNENTPRVHRNLRSTIEKRSLQINFYFLRASQAAQLDLDRVEDKINSLANCYDRITKALSICSASTCDIINTTERLKQNSKLLPKSRR